MLNIYPYTLDYRVALEVYVSFEELLRGHLVNGILPRLYDLFNRPISPQLAVQDCFKLLKIIDIKPWKLNAEDELRDKPTAAYLMAFPNYELVLCRPFSAEELEELKGVVECAHKSVNQWQLLE